MRLSAAQIVDGLLEWNIDPTAPRPGSPEDPFRQTTGPLPPMTFQQRPGVPEPPEEEEDELGAPVKPPLKAKAPPVRPAVHPRFKWRPPNPPGP